MNMNSVPDFFSSLISSDLQGRLLWLQIIFWILTLYLIFGVFYFGRRGGYFRNRHRLSRYWREYKEEFSASKKHEEEWARLENYLKSDLATDHKRAVVEAGRIMEEAVNAAGGGQGSFEDRVRRVVTDGDFDFDELFRAHYLWGQLIENPAQAISLKQAKDVLVVYRQALSALKYF